MLLPLPRATAEGLSLRYHLALEALRIGRGYPAAVNTLTAVTLLTQFLAGAGYGRISAGTQVACEKALADAFSTGNETGEWKLDEAHYAHVEAIVNLHDFQLHTVPMTKIVEAGEQLERMKAAAQCRLSDAMCERT